MSFTIGDVEVHRFPEEGWAPIESCYKQCEKAGLVVASGYTLARLRAMHREKGSLAWTKVRGFSGTTVGVGSIDNISTIVVAHSDHPLMTSEAISRFKKDPLRFLNGAIYFPEAQAKDLVSRWKERYSGFQRFGNVWVLQNEGLIDSEVVFSGIVSATEKATKRTLLVSYLGDPKFKIAYLKGHKVNFGSQIGVHFDRSHFNKNGLSFRPLWFGGNGLSYDYLDGYGSYYCGCVFGVPSNAVGVAQNLPASSEDSTLESLL